jgi:hypothetical protein
VLTHLTFSIFVVPVADMVVIGLVSNEPDPDLITESGCSELQSNPIFAIYSTSPNNGKTRA